MVRRFFTWFSQPGGFDRMGFDAAPAEAVVLRAIGVVYLVVFIATTISTRPHPSLHGKGIAIGLAGVAFVVCTVATQARRNTISQGQCAAWLLGLTAASAVLAALQPAGMWPAGMYFVAIVAPLMLDRATAIGLLTVSFVALAVVTATAGRHGPSFWVLVGAIPWFLVMRLMRGLREKRAELEASRVAEAQAAAEAERGRLAREMHDVLAHSLSALALQLESTRLLARDRGTDEQVTRSIDQAHHLAAQGLDEARRAIAAARGDQLPGPERLEALTSAFGGQSGIPVTLEVTGVAHELPPDARLALYRTAQEALTNIRRHAAPTRVAVQLDYRADATVLAVEDHGDLSAPQPESIDTGSGYGLTGMRERAELLGGRLTAEPTAGGFRVELVLPFEPAGSRPARAGSPG